MSNTNQTTSLSPFPPGYRASGVLLHVTSLPSPYGIGDVGPAAREWIDRLHEAGQTWWQALPLGPTGYGNSPYQPLSSFMGNVLLISPDDLVADGLLRTSETAGPSFSKTAVDYDAVGAFKDELLQRVWANFSARAGRELKLAYRQFQEEQAHWLNDYALYRSLKAKHHGASYLEWPAELVRRSASAVGRAWHELAPQIDQVCLAQFLLFWQGQSLKTYAHAKGVRLIGDLPFFVSPNSSDVWANPELFLLDEQRRPRCVAGVPPDYFCSEGQLWGNPVYDWSAMRQTGYRWWVDRARSLLAHVDLIRLDHFRGFVAAWHIPAGATTARIGQWVPGPGAELFSALQKELGAQPFLAEDLGVVTPDVHALRERFQLPGTRVLQFAFDGRNDNPHLPHNYGPNTVVYTGTHDNNTTRGWFDELQPDQRRIVWSYLNRPGGESGDATPALLHLAWSSAAALALAPLQDLLNLGSDARMNVPGTADGNWRWRCAPDMLSASAFERLRKLTETSNRLPLAQANSFQHVCDEFPTHRAMAG
jgi:4-alpha-glucanotransferase